jgi:hypothetical protein
LKARTLGRYFAFYNSRRPHSSLDRVTPDQFDYKMLCLNSLMGGYFEQYDPVGASSQLSEQQSGYGPEARALPADGMSGVFA